MRDKKYKNEKITILCYIKLEVVLQYITNFPNYTLIDIEITSKYIIIYVGAKI